MAYQEGADSGIERSLHSSVERLALLSLEERPFEEKLNSIREGLIAEGVYDASTFEAMLKKYRATPRTTFDFTPFVWGYLSLCLHFQQKDIALIDELQTDFCTTVQSRINQPEATAVIQGTQEQHGIAALLYWRPKLGVKTTERFGRLFTEAPTAVNILASQPDRAFEASLIQCAAGFKVYPKGKNYPDEWRVSNLGHEDDQLDAVRNFHRSVEGVIADMQKESAAISSAIDELERLPPQKRPEMRQTLKARSAANYTRWNTLYLDAIRTGKVQFLPSVLFNAFFALKKNAKSPVALAQANDEFFQVFDEKDCTGDNLSCFMEDVRTDPVARKELIKRAIRHPGLLKVILHVSTHSSYNMEVAFALELLAAVCEEADKACFTLILNELVASDKKDLLFVFVQFFSDPMAGVKKVVTHLLSQAEITRAIRCTPRGISLEKDLVPGLSNIEDPDIDAVSKTLFAAHQDTRSVIEMLRATPAFDNEAHGRLLEEISEHGSVPLYETVEIDCTELLPPHYHVFLEPKTGDKGTSSIKVTVQAAQFSGGRLKHTLMSGSIENGIAKTSYQTNEINIPFARIAIYAIHKYYVREPSADVKAGLEKRLKDLGERNDTSDATIRFVEGREQKNTLEVDIRPDQKEDDKKRESRLAVKVNRSKELLEAFLRGESVDLEEVFVFRKDSSLSKGKFVYHRLKSSEIAELGRRGVLEEDLYVLRTVPHTSAAGFYEKVSEGGIHTLAPRQATEHSSYGYEVYLENGFEPVGTRELLPYETHLSLRAPAQHDSSELMSIQTDDGATQLLLCPATRMDINAAIIFTLKEGPWFETWIQTLEEACQKDLTAIESSDLPADERARLTQEISSRTALEIAQLRTARDLACIIKGADGVSSRFPFPGTYTSQRLFNQGTFVPLRELLKP